MSDLKLWDASLQQALEGVIQERDEYKRQRDAYSARISRLNDRILALELELEAIKERVRRAIGDAPEGSMRP